ncbi:MAG: hypothetical protein AUK47_19800 [Deltaproteobacteria bacterium CG2_30_63_29]|nr:MAG: hypothetical protein AUK47_19800 [Deltaproteobacteria bacterium CG2_30_63_29]PJB47318.1 MAG: hypothetical protein CO108_04330 [Deltaproteobacteria bacterium CG_4_9_14_3_um_filter_63_12]
MAIALYSSDRVVLASIEASDLPEVQRVFDESPTFHRLVSGKVAPRDIAQRCFEKQPPAPRSAHKIFKRFLSLLPPPVPGEDHSEIIGVIDMYVGYPRYDIATIATLVLRERWQRKGLGSAAAALLTTYMKKEHPAVGWLDLAITDDNHAAAKFLIRSGFQRTDSWQPITVDGQQKRLVRLEMKL